MLDNIDLEKEKKEIIEKLKFLIENGIEFYNYKNSLDGDNNPYLLPLKCSILLFKKLKSELLYKNHKLIEIYMVNNIYISNKKYILISIVNSIDLKFIEYVIEDNLENKIINYFLKKRVIKQIS